MEGRPAVLDLELRLLDDGTRDQPRGGADAVAVVVALVTRTRVLAVRARVVVALVIAAVVSRTKRAAPSGAALVMRIAIRFRRRTAV
jgi:hypothetical protein